MVAEFQYSEEAVVQLGNSPELRALLETIGQKIVNRARQAAEAGFTGQARPHVGSGPRYVDGFEVIVQRLAGPYVELLVINKAHDAVWVEKGAHPGGGPTAVLGIHAMERALLDGGLM